MKLAGIRVLDLSNFLPGPYLTLSMADHGAEVIKIEAPGEGDPGRHIGLSDGPHTVFFRNLNRGKKSIVLDLKDPAQRDTLLHLVESADVFVESFRPGVASRLGIGQDIIRARNPRIVYCSISAFGQTGPNVGRPAHDLAIEAVAGLLSCNIGDNGRPVLPAIPTADVLAGLQGLAGVLMALLARERTGRGDYIDISMQDALVGATLNVLGPTLAQGRAPVVKEERTTGGAAFYNVYDTSDGRQIVLAAQETKFVRTLLDHLGRMDLAPLCEQGPGPHQAPVIAFLSDLFRGLTQAQAIEMLSNLDVGWAPVNDLKEALEDPQLIARDMILKDEQGRRHIAPPIRFSDEPARPSLVAPMLNEHSDTII
ncbi:MAG: CoA transferase [Novosphingobium sp.]|nr:CoA transferase [Novosphingobium sp.]